MNKPSFLLSVVMIPVIGLGSMSCASMHETGGRLAEWKEKRAQEREEARMAREVAIAEQEIAEEAAQGGPVVASGGRENAIFLDYASPSGSLLDGAMAGDVGYGAGGLALPGADLPVVMDLGAMGGIDGGTEDGIFLSEGGGLAAGGVAGLPVDADMVRAWAASISPLMGASLTEPLITAAMTARLSPTESAVAAHAAETDAAPLAQAFAGVPARPERRSLTSELEHE